MIGILFEVFLDIFSILFFEKIVNEKETWVSVLLPTLFCFHRLCYKQLSKNNQNIRNPIPFWCKIKSPQQNCTKQKRGGFPVVNFTSNTYQMKREILTFSNKISRKFSKPDRKFMADMNYDILASNSCLLTDIVDQLHEPSKKLNSVDRLSRHLSKGTPKDALHAYLTCLKKWCPATLSFISMTVTL